MHFPWFLQIRCPHSHLPRAKSSPVKTDNASSVSNAYSVEKNLSQQTLPLMMQYGGQPCSNGFWGWKVVQAISFWTCFSDIYFIVADLIHANLESFLETFSYSLGEEIELLEAIYIHELTLEGQRER